MAAALALTQSILSTYAGPADRRRLIQSFDTTRQAIDEALLVDTDEALVVFTERVAPALAEQQGIAAAAFAHARAHLPGPTTLH